MGYDRYPCLNYKHHTYKGFSLTNDGGPDARWIAWREDGVKLRADTLAGIKQFVTEYLEGRVKQQ